MPTGKHYDPAITGKTQKPSLWDYVEVLKDVRVIVMIFQYSACFGYLTQNGMFCLACNVIEISKMLQHFFKFGAHTAIEEQSLP